MVNKKISKISNMPNSNPFEWSPHAILILCVMIAYKIMCKHIVFSLTMNVLSTYMMTMMNALTYTWCLSSYHRFIIVMHTPTLSLSWLIFSCSYVECKLWSIMSVAWAILMAFPFEFLCYENQMDLQHMFTVTCHSCVQ